MSRWETCMSGHVEMWQGNVLITEHTGQDIPWLRVGTVCYGSGHSFTGLSLPQTTHDTFSISECKLLDGNWVCENTMTLLLKYDYRHSMAVKTMTWNYKQNLCDTHLVYNSYLEPDFESIQSDPYSRTWVSFLRFEKSAGLQEPTRWRCRFSK